MPPRRTSAPQPPPPNASLLIPRDDARLRLQKQIDAAIAMMNVPSSGAARTKKDELKLWREYTEELLKRIFDQPSVAKDFSWATRSRRGGLVIGGEDPWDATDDFFTPLRDGIQALQSLSERLELIPEAPGIASTAGKSASQRPVVAGNRVFVVHGHDHGLRAEACSVLRKLGLEPIVLEEQASGGKTVIEKFEYHAADSSFAVVLLSPDDVGGPKGCPPEELRPRARQNVIGELFYFCGRLGRRHVCALHSAEIELPSDLAGVVWVTVDPAGAWHFKLGKELKAAGLTVDLNNL